MRADLEGVSVGGVPSDPRTPSPRARKLIFGYRGTQKVALFIGVIFTVLGLMLFSTIRSNRREITAYTNGTPASAKVNYAGWDYAVAMGGRHPFKIDWEFTVGTNRYKGTLSSMEQSDLVEFAEQRYVVVLYLPGNPRINTLYVA